MPASPTAQAFCTFFKRALELPVVRVGGPCAGDDDAVVACFIFPWLRRKIFADAAADAVAHDGVAELGADRDAETVVSEPIFAVIHHKAGRNTGLALGIHPAEFVIFLDGGGAFHA